MFPLRNFVIQSASLQESVLACFTARNLRWFMSYFQSDGYQNPPIWFPSFCCSSSRLTCICVINKLIPLWFKIFFRYDHIIWIAIGHTSKPIFSQLFRFKMVLICSFHCYCEKAFLSSTLSTTVLETSLR